MQPFCKAQLFRAARGQRRGRLEAGIADHEIAVGVPTAIWVGHLTRIDFGDHVLQLDRCRQLLEPVFHRSLLPSPHFTPRQRWSHRILRPEPSTNAQLGNWTRNPVGFSNRSPVKTDVRVVEPVARTPRSVIHVCSASITTPTDRGARLSTCLLYTSPSPRD